MRWGSLLSFAGQLDLAMDTNTVALGGASRSQATCIPTRGTKGSKLIHKFRINFNVKLFKKNIYRETITSFTKSVLLLHYLYSLNFSFPVTILLLSVFFVIIVIIIVLLVLVIFLFILFLLFFDSG
jgi:hypothetical protein